MLTIYSLLSHSTDLLPSHLAAIRANLPPSRQVVIQGPYSRNIGYGGGTVRLTGEDAERLGVTILESPDAVLGLMTPYRVEGIADWIWSDVIPKQIERYAMISHGDLIPVRKMTITQLLAGQPVATRIIEVQGRRFAPLTWMLADWRGNVLAQSRSIPCAKAGQE